MFFENNLSGQNFVLHKKICWHTMFLSQMLLTGMVRHNTLLNILGKHCCQLVKVEKTCTIAATKFSFRFAMRRRIFVEGQKVLKCTLLLLHDLHCLSFQQKYFDLWTPVKDCEEK